MSPIQAAIALTGVCLLAGMPLSGCSRLVAEPQVAPVPPQRSHIGMEEKSEGRPTGTKRFPTAKERAVITELMQKLERVRGLRFDAEVPVLIEDEEAVVAYASHELIGPEFERLRKTYVAIGLLPEHLDVQHSLVSLLGEQVVGYYDAKEKHLVVRDDIIAGLSRGSRDKASQAAREVLVHELAHALQDQHLGLAHVIEEASTADQQNAVRALLEGDATLSAAGYAAGEAGFNLRGFVQDGGRLQNMANSVRSAAETSPHLSSAPEILREPLLFAYAEGLVYAGHLFAEVDSFERLNAAFLEPPGSTEAVLHPNRPHNQPPPLELPKLEVISSEGFMEVSRETLGELELSIYFAMGVPREQARRAADGWDGDRLIVMTNPQQQLCVVWLMQWDSPHDAIEAERAANEAVHAQCGSECAAYDVRRRGRRVVVMLNIPPDIQAQLASLVLSRHLDRADSAH